MPQPREVFSSPIDSVVYRSFLYKLFIASVLGTRLLSPEIIFLVLRPCQDRKTMAETPPVVLTIAGFDPSSGAGVTADIKTIAAHGCYGVACITAMTVQSTAGVRRVEAVDPGLITETLKELAADIPIAAVHIGMLGTAKVVRAVAEFLAQRQGKSKLPNVVLDPILRSSSGAEPAGCSRNQAADRKTHPAGRPSLRRTWMRLPSSLD